jgi:hypothetical protein
MLDAHVADVTVGAAGEAERHECAVVEGGLHILREEGSKGDRHQESFFRLALKLVLAFPGATTVIFFDDIIVCYKKTTLNFFESIPSISPCG